MVGLNTEIMYIKRLIVISIVSILSVTIPMIYFMRKENTTCDTRVLMKDGTEYSVIRVFHTTDGMTWTKDCVGIEKSFPTVDIETIEKINQ